MEKSTILYILSILIIILLIVLYTQKQNEAFIFDTLNKLLNNEDIQRLTKKTKNALSYLERDPKAAIGSLFKKPENKPLPEVANFIMKYANYYVVDISVCKTPVVETIKTLMNILSGGELSQRVKQKGIPDLFHLFMNVTLMNFNTGHTVQITMEKDEVVKIVPMRSRGDCLHVNIDKEITFADFVNNAIKIHPQMCSAPFWIYDSADSNCQVFVEDFILGNYEDVYFKQDLVSFVNQGSQELLEGLGLAKGVSRKITDLYANLKQFVYL